MRIHILSILFCFIIASQSFYLEAQLLDRSTNLPTIDAPNVASFNKFIDHPIGLYNGIPDITIPIYTLTDGVINLPITLRYNSSGIKVTEEASWVGLGWNLNVGGCITQRVNGRSDDVFNPDGYKAFIKRSDISHFFSTPLRDHFVYLKYDSIVNRAFEFVDIINNKELGRLEPDVFYFNYPGNSGKFVIDYRTNKPYVLSKEEDIKIEFKETPKTNQIEGFSITTNTGIVHKFECAIFNQLEEVTKTFALVETKYPNGSIVSYDYEVVEYPSIFPIQSYFVTKKLQAGYEIPTGGDPNPSKIGNSLNIELSLKSITTPNYKISFITDDRIDLMLSDKNRKSKSKLSEILINNLSNDHKQSKKLKFEYDYFKSIKSDLNTNYWTAEIYKNNTDYEQWASNRLCLLKTYEIDKDGKKTNEHSFSYNKDVSLPRKDSYSVDYWGSYNGVLNTTSVPDLNILYFANESFNDARHLYNSWRENIPRKANRAYSEKHSKAAILTGIAYPTGGYMEYTYEPNKFEEIGAKRWRQGDPLMPITQVPHNIEDIISPFIADQSTYFNNTKFIEVYDHNATASAPKNKTFTVSKNATNFNLAVTIKKGSSCFWNDILYYSDPGNATDPSFGGQNLKYNVEIKKQNTQGQYVSFGYYKIIKSGSETAQAEANIEIELEPGNYILSVEFPEKIICNSRDGEIRAKLTFQENPSISTLSSIGCGLRVKNIKSYNVKGDKDPILTTEFNYTGGMLHDIIDYATFSKRTDHQNKFMYVKDYLDISSSNLVTNTYGNSSGVGYSSVKVLKTNNGNNQGYTEYIFHNKKGLYRFGYGGVKYDEPLNGKELEINTYSNSNVLKSKIKKDYSASLTNEFYGINISNTFYGKEPTNYTYYSYIDYDIIASFQSRNPGDRYRILKYGIPSYSITLSSAETLQDGVTTKETYTYNPQTLQMQKKIVKLDGSNSLTYEYKYPNDMNCTGTNPFSLMTKENFIAPVIEERIYRDKQYLGGVFNEYKRVVGLTSNKYQSVLSNTYYSEASANNTIKSESVTYTQAKGLDGSVYPTANISYHNYDQFGNPIYISYNSETHIVYLWGYGGQYPVAEIKNATYAEVKTALGVTPESLSSAASPDFSLLNGLRDKLPNAHITTYEYQPLVGIITMINPRKVITKYEYDSFGRLKTSSYTDEKWDKKVLQEYQYNYRNQ